MSNYVNLINTGNEVKIATFQKDDEYIQKINVTKYQLKFINILTEVKTTNTQSEYVDDLIGINSIVVKALFHNNTDSCKFRLIFKDINNKPLVTNEYILYNNGVLDSMIIGRYASSYLVFNTMCAFMEYAIILTTPPTIDPVTIQVSYIYGNKSINNFIYTNGIALGRT